MLQVIVCDDDKIFRETMVAALQKATDWLNVKLKISQFSGLEDISDYILSRCDIAFLDIDYFDRDYTGIDIARRIKKLRPDAVIIFVTNFIEYATEGYEVQAFRYVLKSELKYKLKRYLEDAIQHLEYFRRTIKFKIEGEIIDLSIDDILYLEAQQHHVKIQLVKKSAKQFITTYFCYDTLTNMEKELEPLGFLRIHKSYLVNMQKIQKFQCHEALLVDGTILRVSEKNYRAQKQKYLLWKGVL